MDGQRNKRRRNIAENFSRLRKVHERYRRQSDRQTDGRRHIVNMNYAGNVSGILIKPGCRLHNSHQ